MMNFGISYSYFEAKPPGVWFWVVLVALGVWELVWKAKGLWRAARNKQVYWFVAMLITNTVGILPIVYIKFFQPTKNKKG